MLAVTRRSERTIASIGVVLSATKNSALPGASPVVVPASTSDVVVVVNGCASVSRGRSPFQAGRAGIELAVSYVTAVSPGPGVLLTLMPEGSVIARGAPAVSESAKASSTEADTPGLGR